MMQKLLAYSCKMLIVCIHSRGELIGVCRDVGVDRERFELERRKAQLLPEKLVPDFAGG